ncbi:uncharacterized protein LY89DRAFT_782376 [Mollisia scopiformis]|uniref:EthD domain-containing protein n=1 Tax=Mollisia scopiformis TaxID=149040 RepID=A0A194XAM5_MOLSC|nr:uncharacterized protein LY89DRAFT_782376 [Mollisia scopiformis]KUJ17194.1 hypothetical protein LY89DRAFT_782376 [Mollisia scopiformis]
MPINQGLMKRNPDLTPEQFSESWYKDHRPLLVPYFLSCGITYYAQIHAPLSTTSPDIDISEWSGAAEMPSEDVLKIWALSTLVPQWKQDYYDEVIRADEIRLLGMLAHEQILQVGPGTVKGERKILIKDGKAVVEVPEGAWEVWRTYEKRGEGLEKSR